MIQNGDSSIRERIKSDVLQEIQRVLLTYEERIAVLEKRKSTTLGRKPKTLQCVR